MRLVTCFVIHCGLLLGCARPPSAAKPSVSASYRADVVASFMNAVDSEAFYAIPAAHIASWSNVAVMRLPKDSRSSSLSVRLDSGSAPPKGEEQRVFLIVLRGYSGEPPYAGGYGSASVFPIGPRALRTDSAFTEHDGDRACAGGDWLAAFFIRGFGAPPTGPLIVFFTSNGVTRRLRVNPAEHSIGPEMALHLTESDVKRDSLLAHTAIVTIRSGRSPSLMPVLLWREPFRRPAHPTEEEQRLMPPPGAGSDRWNGALALARNGYLGLSLSPELRPTPIEWRLYLLDAPPRC